MKDERFEFTATERKQALTLYAELKDKIASYLGEDDEEKIRQHLTYAIEHGQVERDVFGLNPIITSLQTALLVVDEIGLRRDAVIAIMLYPSVMNGTMALDAAADMYGQNVARILHGLLRIQELYKKNPVIESENFRNLLLSFAEDMRVILIMIADRVNLMRQIRDADNASAKHQVSEEAAYLYAPLAHKLGLYKLKSELEDLSLKYLEPKAYYHIKEKLNATKTARDAYIKRFIGPVEQKLTEAGLNFHMKGRTKSIHSIWQKMKKQKCTFEGVYDLFAIRIIIDCPREKEKMTCWQTFALITDMYTSNPKRMRDWLSVPKSNGYESLHITVLGPEEKWVEVQIRTERMDEIAERGVAAHWRYKGVKAESGMDDWLNNIRSMLENSTGMEAMDQFKMDLYDDEIYVFTPKGDLLKFPKGATVLDMAYHIHSKVGSTCTGARINGKVTTFRQQLRSGDQVEIMTSTTQRPKQEWLNIVKTSRAKSKIRLALKETQQKEALMVKEMLERKFKNRKIELEESVIMRTMKKLGYKEASDFYRDLAEGTLDYGSVIDKYVELQQGEKVYSGTMVFGATTPCYDLERAIDQYYPYQHITHTLLNERTQQFVGQIDQVPPVFSAVKIGGQRAYSYARQVKEGEEIPSPTPKKVIIEEFEITSFRPGRSIPENEQSTETPDHRSKVSAEENTLTTLSPTPLTHLYNNPLGTIPQHLPQADFRIRCGKGTYIRSLARDLGLALDSGAFLSALRREQVGKYSLKDAIQLEDIHTFLNQ